MNKTLYYSLRATHILLTLFTLFGWIFNNLSVLYIVLGVQIFTIILYLFNNGCILIKLEKKINPEHKSIMRIIFEQLGINASPNTIRMTMLVVFLVALAITGYKIVKLRNDKIVVT